MDVYPNGPVSSGHLKAGRQPETTAPSMASSSIQGGFLTGEIEEGGDDMSLQWLSMFMEDCLSAAPILYPTTSHHHHPPPTTTTTTLNPPTHAPNQVQPSPHEPTIPSKARTKRRKLNSRTHRQAFHVVPPDPPLLLQTHWLADSELIFPKKEHEDKKEEEEEEEEERVGEKEVGQQQQQPRRCTHCQSHRTPQWRGGPLGPKTLCNACGVRFKSGRLLPEYRPAKSPTFVSYKHSNSHKKVMEMRMSLLPSHSK